MNKQSFFLLIIIYSLCSSCNKKENIDSNQIQDEKITSPSQSYFDDFVNQDKIKALTDKSKNGDTIAYRNLRHIYFYSDHVKEFLYNAMTIAEKHDYPLAYYDVYTILYSPDNNDSRTNKLANYYLFKAYEKKSEHAETTIKERLGDSYKIPKSQDYWVEINR
jgi:hypothetical protein